MKRRGRPPKSRKPGQKPTPKPVVAKPKVPHAFATLQEMQDHLNVQKRQLMLLMRHDAIPFVQIGTVFRIPWDTIYQMHERPLIVAEEPLLRWRKKGELKYNKTLRPHHNKGMEPKIHVISSRYRGNPNFRKGRTNIYWKKMKELTKGKG